MNKVDLLRYLDKIEQDIRDIDGNEDEMREQLAEIADDIMNTLDDFD